MKPLVLLSNNLSLFIEINRHCNDQGWFISNMTDSKKNSRHCKRSRSLRFDLGPFSRPIKRPSQRTAFDQKNDQWSNDRLCF